MPPVRPPALFERWIQRPSSPRPSITSWTADPNRRVCSNPSPNSTPLTMLMLMTAAASAASSRRSQWTYEPSPIGTPWATTSKTPPTVSPSDARLVDPGDHPRLGLGIGAAQRDGVGLVARAASRRAGSTATPPTSAVNDQTSTPSSARNARATPPAATRAVVSRARRPLEHVADVVEAVLEGAGEVGVAGPHAGHRRRPLVAARRPRPASSAASSSLERLDLHDRRSSSPSRGSRSSSRIGEPSVRPWRTPATISARSCSIAWRAPRP